MFLLTCLVRVAAVNDIPADDDDDTPLPLIGSCNVPFASVAVGRNLNDPTPSDDVDCDCEGACSCLTMLLYALFESFNPHLVLTTVPVPFSSMVCKAESLLALLLVSLRYELKIFNALLMTSLLCCPSLNFALKDKLLVFSL